MRPVPTHGWPALLATLLLAAGCSVGCSAGSPTPAGGANGAVGGAGAVPSAASASSPATAPASAGASGAAGGSAGTSTGARAIARSVPTRLLIPDIGVDTPVMSLGLAADGTVQVPPIKQASPAGWYQGSPTPGQTGPSVLLGHVTVGQYGDGVFKKLDQLRPGARVLVRLADGATAEFVVDRVRTVAKDNFPSDEVYGNVDRPELRLITCGGAHTADGYTDNVVVFASLSGSAG
ncbi:hypothetical protein GCM10009839_90880 [Catenulispora yoronensis]|uniref:Class F sortase n=1 Tax=Catenulispora yoronensis TaxID=450799 RepID=A0ABN2VL95_9ACTN